MINLAQISLTTSILAMVLIVVSIVMVVVILVQKPKGGGLSGAFGGGAGAGSSEQLMGGNVGDVLTWFTVSICMLFVLLLLGVRWSSGMGEDTRRITAEPEPIEVDDAETEDSEEATEVQETGEDEVVE